MHLLCKLLDGSATLGVAGDVADVDAEDALRVLRDDLRVDLRVLLPAVTEEQEGQRRIRIQDLANRVEFVGAVPDGEAAGADDTYPQDQGTHRDVAVIEQVCVHCISGPWATRD